MSTNNSSPKIAIFYDWLNQWGGAERVLLNLLQIYPQAHLYTLVHNPGHTPWLPPNTHVFPSFLNCLPLSSQNPLIYTPFYTLALEQFDFSQYDIVISTTSTVGHVLLTQPHTLFLCYYHNINRYLYLTPKKYFLLKPLLHLYRHFDLIHSHRPDYLLCNSVTVQKRILSVYHRPALIIHPGIDTDFFHPSNLPPENYFLIVSRLVPHKNITIAIHACGKSNLPLKIIGSGRFQNQLKNIAKPYKSVQFLNHIDDHQLRKYYQNSLALICPQEEDFGLTPIESQACGRPVIALNRGGCTETVKNLQTGIFFPRPTAASLSATLALFSRINFNPTLCRQQALKFSRKNFMLHFKNTVNRLWFQHRQSPNSNTIS